MTTAAIAPAETLPRLTPSTKAFLHTGFFLTGMLSAILGPLIPYLALHTGVPAQRAGTLFVAQFVASSLAAAFYHIDLKRSLAFGWLLIAAAMLLFTTNSWTMLHVASTLNGLGLGLCIPATNIIVSSRAQLSSASALSILNLMWSAGAAAVAGIIASLTFAFGRAGAFVLLSVVSFVLVICTASMVEGAALPRSATRPVLSSSIAISASSCFTLFVYIGVETCVGGWIATYAVQRGVPVLAAGTGLTLYWVGLILGRGVAPLLLAIMPGPVLRISGLAVATTASALMLRANSAIDLWFCAAACGLGLAPVFPITVARLERRARAAHIPVYGWVFAVSGLGGALLPWISGRILQSTGSVQYALLVPPIATGLLLIFALPFAIGGRKTSSPVQW